MGLYHPDLDRITIPQNKDFLYSNAGKRRSAIELRDCLGLSMTPEFQHNDLSLCHPKKKPERAFDLASFQDTILDLMYLLCNCAEMSS